MKKPSLRLDISNLTFPGSLALVSYNVKRLKPGQTLEVILKEHQMEELKRWSTESGNILKVINKNLCQVERGKGFHGVCLNEKLSFYITGAKLHLKEFLLKLSNKYPPFLVNFISLREGERALKLLPKEGFTVLPAPKEIEGYCGFAVGCFEEKRAKELFFNLLDKKVGVEALFQRTPQGFKTLLTSWEV